MLPVGSRHSPRLPCWLPSTARRDTARHSTARHAPPPRQTLPALSPRHLQEPFPTSRGRERSRCWGSPRAPPGSSPAPAFCLSPGRGSTQTPTTAQPSPASPQSFCLALPSHEVPAPGSHHMEEKPPTPPTRRELLAVAGAAARPVCQDTPPRPHPPRCTLTPARHRPGVSVQGVRRWDTVQTPAGAGVSPPRPGRRASPYRPFSHRLCSAPQRSRLCLAPAVGRRSPAATGPASPRTRRSHCSS